MKKGAKPEKTVLGVPLYGRAFTLMNPNSNKMGAPAKSTSFQGPYTREDGFMGYNEICLEANDQEAPWTEVWEEHHMAPYMYRYEVKYIPMAPCMYRYEVKYIPMAPYM